MVERGMDGGASGLEGLLVIPRGSATVAKRPNTDEITEGWKVGVVVGSGSPSVAKAI